MNKLKDITGQKFGKLIAIKFIKRENKRTYWQYKCDCGNVVIKRIDRLTTMKNIQNCGCMKRIGNYGYSHYKHGMTRRNKRKRFYRIWGNIKNRCLNKKEKCYKNYGGRGIKICDRWLESFENFRDDMYKNYLEHVKKFGEKDTTIDRKDNNGDYCKENCIWATRKIQENNRRNNHFLTYNGEIMTISQWANKLKLGNNSLFNISFSAT